MDFGDLQEDQAIKEKITNFHDSIESIDKILDAALNFSNYEKLSTKEKVDFDLFQAYTLNTLFWLYLRSKGEDPNKCEVRTQLSRIKEYMNKAKLAHERHTIRPRIDQPAAKRFVKHGIHSSKKNRAADSPRHFNKKIKFSD